MAKYTKFEQMSRVAQWVRKSKKVQQKIKKGATKKTRETKYCKNCTNLSS